MHLVSTLFPLPLMPMIWFTFPCSNTAEISVSTWLSPKRLLSPWTSIIAGARA